MKTNYYVSPTYTVFGNVKFAEFLGWKITDVGTHKYLLPTKLAHNNYAGTLVSDTGLLFNRDWNWLIYVVEQIITNMFDFSESKVFQNSKELQDLDGKDFVNFIVDYEPNEGWYFQINMKITNIPVVQRSEFHYENQIDCTYEACLAFVEKFISNNLKIVSHE